jgi:hypothetical protein
MITYVEAIFLVPTGATGAKAEAEARTRNAVMNLIVGNFLEISSKNYNRRK